MFNMLGGDLDDDPIFGFHSRAMNQMNAMMNSVMSDAFGDMMGGMRMPGMGFPGLLGGPLMGMGGGQMMPRGRPGPGMMNPFMMDAGNNGLSYSSSSMTSMTIGPDGRPQVYQATSTTKAAPGGVKETTKTVSDSRTGTKKMAIGHHIGERSHIIEQRQNTRTGQREEHIELVNLSDDETEEFNNEWQSATRGYPRSSSANQRRIAHYGGVTIEDVTEDTGNREQLALAAPPPSTSQRVRHPKTSPSTSKSQTSHERAKKRDHGAGGSSRAAKQHRSKHTY
ncbi:myeloid leukemia factor isoform X2 [Neocloeon triangulifer]|uniref:myeloid leukemia factor isoform X2 n=1 Tax=Neocloeon triangulifer TaxID=2078957 RepID=UPI00286F073F|nr:myeloid leukemia factor isoform X2 [Neocloeon triangulifer]